MQSTKTWTRLLLLAGAVLQTIHSAGAATYQVGNIVSDFTLVARRAFTNNGALVRAGSIVHLRDFEGKIVFLEWFAVWCPFCVAAAPQVQSGIVDYYNSRGGNPYGVPVLHIAVNQEPLASYQSQTDSFITQQGFNPVMNDYDNLRTNRVRFLFQSSGQPIFAVINGVTNSPTHQPWQLLVNHLGYGQTDFNQELANDRAVIDKVQSRASPSQLSEARSNGAGFEFKLQAQSGRSYRVQGSTNLGDWTTLRSITAITNTLLFRDTNAPLSRFYRAVTP